MAKETLLSTVDPSEVVDLGEEINIPNFQIDETYGIIVDEYNATLVERKIASRTGKEADGVNEGKVIRYISWTPVKAYIYGRDIFGALENYSKYVTAKKISELNKCTNFNEVKQIYLDTQSTIRQALESSQFADDIKQKAILVSEIEELKGMLNDARKVFGEVAELRQLVKDSRKIIVSDMENKPKQHRTPKEKEEE